MGRHEKAWSGLNIIIFGKKALLPMQLEQSIASVAPANEVNIDSFEDYDDALSFCKQKKTVGFILIVEDSGSLMSPSVVFSQFSKVYEARGWPCFGALIREGQETFLGLRTMRSNPGLIDYIETDQLLNPTKTSATIDSLWKGFVQAFEENLIPVPLQQTLISIASSSLSEDSVFFVRRVAGLLTNNLNISWIEKVAIDWFSIVAAVEKNSNLALAPHSTLVQICNLARYTGQASDAMVLPSNSLCARICAALTFINDMRQSGSLESELMKLGANSKPGSPALIRHIVSLREKIIEISGQELNSSIYKKTSG